MYYISTKTFNEAFGYSRNSIFNFIKIHQKKELIEKYNVHYGKIDFMLDEKENKFYKLINFNKDEILDEIKFGIEYRFGQTLFIKDDKEKFYELNLNEIHDIK